MNDSREKFEKALDRGATAYERNAQGNYASVLIQGAWLGWQAAETALRDQWISVDERPPIIPDEKHGVTVLAGKYCGCGDFEHCEDWFATTVSYMRDGSWKWNMDSNPTHWQPLPLPPSSKEPI